MILLRRQPIMVSLPCLIIKLRLFFNMLFEDKQAKKLPKAAMIILMINYWLKRLATLFPVNRGSRNASKIISPAVLVFQVVGMFPNITSKNGKALNLCNLH
jgi:hypothetical protein